MAKIVSPPLSGNLMSKQRGESWRVGTEAAIGMPDMIAQILVFHRINHGRVGIFRRARRVRSSIMEELAEEAGESGEVFGRHRAGLEDRQATIVQKIAQRGTEFIGQRLAVEAGARDIEPSAGWICATRTPDGISDPETSLTAEVDMGSDLPLRPLLFEPET